MFLKRNRLKIGLIGLYIAAGAAEIWRRLVLLNEYGFQPVALFAFLTLFIACLISIFGAAFMRNHKLRWLFACLFAAGALIVDGYQWTIGDFMDYEAFITMTNSSGDLGEAATQYGWYMTLALGKAIILIVAIGLKPDESNNYITKFARYSALPILFALTALLYIRGGEGASGLPPSHSGASFGLLYGLESLTGDNRPREHVSIKVKGPKSATDIVLIIDESIAGAYLDINSKTGVYSGLKNPDIKTPIHNFGLAAAINNCSVGSNVTMRFGGKRDNYRDTVKYKPSIWAYAKAANLGTIYIDAQRTDGAYQNLMNDAERALIDQWIQFDDVPVLQRDQNVADRLSEILNDEKQQFILINKVGAHFPVSDKFPDSHAQYVPMLKRQNFNISDGPKDELDGRKSNWVFYRNSYRNSLRWNVGGFFDRLFAKSEIGDALIFYTSDHGQTFHERGEYGEATHCTPNPQIEEGVVPLVVIGGQSLEQNKWMKAAKTNHNKMSGYRIFPTLLKSMGYAEGDIEKTYGSDLFSAKPDPFTFNIKFNARLGKDPVFKHISVDEIAHPPISDYQQ